MVSKIACINGEQNAKTATVLQDRSALAPACHRRAASFVDKTHVHRPATQGLHLLLNLLGVRGSKTPSAR